MDKCFELKYCKRCAYHDDFTGVCVNADSEHVADFTSDDESCEFFEREEVENE